MVFTIPTCKLDAKNTADAFKHAPGTGKLGLGARPRKYATLPIKRPSGCYVIGEGGIPMQNMLDGKWCQAWAQKQLHR